MVVKWCVVLVCYFTCVTWGHVITKQDYKLNEIREDNNIGRDNKLERILKEELNLNDLIEIETRGRGSKDMLYPLLIGAVTKIVTIVPVFLTMLALVAGFSLATSKAALLLGGVLLFYHYVTEGHLLVPVSKQWKHLMHNWGGLSGHHSYLGHGYSGFHRDRNDRRWDLGDTH